MLQRGVLTTESHNKIQPKLLTFIENLLLRRKTLIGTINDQFKDFWHIEHTIQGSLNNAFVPLLAR